jgi:hypothetical protein
MSSEYGFRANLYSTRANVWGAYTRVIQKGRFPIFHLNKITTYRATHEAEIQSHISFTSPQSSSLFRQLS